MTGRAAAALLVAAAACGLPRPALAQYFELERVRDTTAAGDSIRVGDVVTFRALLRSEPQWSLADPVPKPFGELPAGVAVLGADSVRKLGPGKWEGTVRLAFFRPGVQPVPDLAIVLRRIGADRGNPVRAVAQTIEIVPVLPSGGEPVVRDIRAPKPVPGQWLLAAGLLALPLLGLALWWRRRARRLAAARPPATGAPRPPAPDARALALERLRAIEAAGLASAGAVDRHYAEVADVLRDFLHDERLVPRLRPATRELLDALAREGAGTALAPPTARLLTQADLVKYAALRPDAERAGAYLEATRTLLAEPAGEAPDAVR